MDKIIKVLGCTKQNPLGEAELDLPVLLRNIVYVVIALCSLCFTAGNKFSVARSIPASIDAIKCAAEANDKKVAILERKQEVTEVQLANIATSLTAIQTDVREIRTAQMRGR